VKKAIKRKWVAALRSGEYKQTARMLFRSFPEPSHCCLGVLRHCVTGRNSGTAGQVGGVGNGLLSIPFLSRVGLTETQQTQLARFNDNGSSFDQIANYIEKNL
jgi:hypothetical protein